MRKKKDKHTEPKYSKNSTRAPHNKSKSQHSILVRHQKKLEQFADVGGRLKDIDRKIDALRQELTNLRKECSFKELNHESNTDIIPKIDKIEDNIKTYELTKQKIASSEDENQYLLDSYHIIMRYADVEEKENQILTKKTLDEGETEQLNILQTEKTDLVDAYLRKFDDNYVSFKQLYQPMNNSCEECHTPLESQNGFLVCPSCGICMATIEHCSELSFKEMQDYDYRPQFTYDKMTHLEDWLRRFQAKENRLIPQDVLDKVVLEAQKSRIKDLNLLTEDKVKRFLKNLELNEYYDNVIGIINRINGRPPFNLTPEVETKIKTMFQQIQEPFNRYKPKTRKNFLSYAYTLHKLFQILGMQEVCKYFPLLKSADKLRQQDDVFKKIVAEMAMTDKSVNWRFYPSI